jgi:hypothetical protein
VQVGAARKPQPQILEEEETPRQVVATIHSEKRTTNNEKPEKRIWNNKMPQRRRRNNERLKTITCSDSISTKKIVSQIMQRLLVVHILTSIAIIGREISPNSEHFPPPFCLEEPIATLQTDKTGAKCRLKK